MRRRAISEMVTGDQLGLDFGGVDFWTGPGFRYTLSSSARMIAAATSDIRAAPRLRPRGSGSRRDFRMVAGCSHFKTDACGTPPSPVRSNTCQGPSRTTVLAGITTISLASSLRRSGERTRTGRRFGSSGSWHQYRRPRSNISVSWLGAAVYVVPHTAPELLARAPRKSPRPIARPTRRRARARCP